MEQVLNQFRSDKTQRTKIRRILQMIRQFGLAVNPSPTVQTQ